MITWQKQEDVTPDVLDVVWNYHVDEVWSDNPKCMIWATLRYHATEPTKINAVVVYDKTTKTAYEIFDEEGAPEYNSERAEKLKDWAFRQYNRLRDKLAA